MRRQYFDVDSMSGSSIYSEHSLLDKKVLSIVEMLTLGKIAPTSRSGILTRVSFHLLDFKKGTIYMEKIYKTEYLRVYRTRENT